MKKRCFNATIILIIIVAFSSCKEKKGSSRVFFDISILDTLTFDFPIRRVSSKGQNFYSYDFYNKSLLKHNLDFQIVDSLGKWGEAPHENLLIRNYEVRSDNKVYIFDTEKHSFKIQDFSDSVYFYHKFKSKVDRGVVISDSLLFTVSDRTGFRLNFSFFNLFDFSFKPVQELNALMDEEYSMLTYEGKLYSLDEKIIHTAYFSDFWFVYNSSLNKVFVYDYLFDYDKPEVVTVGGGIMLNGSSEIILDSFGHGDYIFMLSNVADRNFPEQRVLDIYDINNGNYLKSYILPKHLDRLPTEGFSLKSNKVGFLYEDSIILIQLN
jgi:hypothetical protein